MSRARLLILLVALGCAIAAALLFLNLLRTPTDVPAVAVTQPAPEPRTEVLVAAKDLMMGERLLPGAIEWRDWPSSNVVDNMITRSARPDALESLTEARARLPILMGEPIADRKIVQPNDRGLLSAVLPKGMRAIAIEVSERTAVSGFVLPNDRVDVLLTTAEAGTTARPIITNVKVLAINQVLGPPASDVNSLPGLQNAVLELDPEQAAMLTAAAASGTLSLALRSIAEGGDAGLVNELPETARRQITIIRSGVAARVSDD